jgi:hypothetical protein
MSSLSRAARSLRANSRLVRAMAGRSFYDTEAVPRRYAFSRSAASAWASGNRCP